MEQERGGRWPDGSATEQRVVGSATEQRVVVVDVTMKFWSMVIFPVKLAIAFIPAAIILFVVGALIVGLFSPSSN